jgi:hypothetical protein
VIDVYAEMKRVHSCNRKQAFGPGKFFPP